MDSSLNTNTPLTNPRRDMWLAVAAFAIAVIIWQMQGLYFVTYPLRLFVTMIHELGHGLSAVFTGGDFLHFEVSQHGAGLAYTRGGTRFVIIQAGYLGTAIFGAVLLVVTNRTLRLRAIAMGLAGLIGLLTLVYSGISVDHFNVLEIIGLTALIIGATYTILTTDSEQGKILATVMLVAAVFGAAAFGGEDSTPLTLLVGACSATLLGVIGYRANRDVILFTLNFLAFMTGLQAITDVWVLTKIVSLPDTMMPMNDASAMAAAYGGSALLWAIWWVLVDIVLFGSAVYFAFVRPMRRS